MKFTSSATRGIVRLVAALGICSLFPTLQLSTRTGNGETEAAPTAAVVLVDAFVPTARDLPTMRKRPADAAPNELQLRPLPSTSHSGTTERAPNAVQLSASPAAEVVDGSAETSVDNDGDVDRATARKQKVRLLSLLRVLPTEDPVLCDPLTKEDLVITSQPPGPLLLGGSPWAGRPRTVFRLRSPSHAYGGTSDTYLNLLEPLDADEENDEAWSAASSSPASRAYRRLLDRAVRTAAPLVPAPVRWALSVAGLSPPGGKEYVPMRDLFTSPSVSFAYERGWRQNFASAGFPGPDREAEMAMEYFEPAMRRAARGDVAAVTSKSATAMTTLVDMSCATGLFTRRFARSGKYDRVLGCDYSDSMLEEARRRIEQDPQLRSSSRTSRRTQLDLIRLDVGRIPMKDGSVDAMNAGAAMHCWPDLKSAASEIYRVLKPGGRYFATTFLSSWFKVVQNAEGGAMGPSRQAFQYFASVDQLRDLMESGGFDRDKILIEILGNACVVIRCEK